MLGLYENDFLMLSGCVALFSISIFLIVFCLGMGERQNQNSEENLNGKSLGEFDFGKSLNGLIIHALLLLYGFSSCNPCLIEIISSFDSLKVKVFTVLMSLYSRSWV